MFLLKWNAGRREDGESRRVLLVTDRFELLEETIGLFVAARSGGRRLAQIRISILPSVRT